MSEEQAAPAAETDREKNPYRHGTLEYYKWQAKKLAAKLAEAKNLKAVADEAETRADVARALIGPEFMPGTPEFKKEFQRIYKQIQRQAEREEKELEKEQEEGPGALEYIMEQAQRHGRDPWTEVRDFLSVQIQLAEIIAERRNAPRQKNEGRKDFIVRVVNLLASEAGVETPIIFTEKPLPVYPPHPPDDGLEWRPIPHGPYSHSLVPRSLSDEEYLALGALFRTNWPEARRLYAEAIERSKRGERSKQASREGVRLAATSLVA